MLQWLKRKSETQRIGHEIYERIVAQARNPVFFQAAGVPDSMEGRLEMIMLHLILMLDRLKTEGAPGQRLGQRLVEHLMADLDDALRQIGIGDMGVPRRVNKAAAAFAERSRDYLAGLSCPGNTTPGGGDKLTAALLRHVYGASDASAAGHLTLQAATPQAAKLAAYVRAAAGHLATISNNDLFEGRELFPAPLVSRTANTDQLAATAFGICGAKGH